MVLLDNLTGRHYRGPSLRSAIRVSRASNALDNSRFAPTLPRSAQAWRGRLRGRLLRNAKGPGVMAFNATSVSEISSSGNLGDPGQVCE